MLKKRLALLLTLVLLADRAPIAAVDRAGQAAPVAATGTLEKMIVADGSVTLDIDPQWLGRTQAPTAGGSLHFALTPSSFFTILVFNNELRGPRPSSVELVAQDPGALPATLASRRLTFESTSWGGPSELVIRDGKTGLVLFNIAGEEYGYDAPKHLLDIRSGRLQVSPQLARELGRPWEAGSAVGTISMAATMRVIESATLADGMIESDRLPAQPSSGTVPGPDVIVGDLSGLAQFGAASGTQVGLAVGTDSCNAGTVDLNWMALPNNDHPVIPQNLYRMSGGATNDARFEQIGQSNVKHAFTALTENICGFGCNGVGATRLGSGCSDPYTASLNSGSGTNSLGSRAWINPFTGAYPRGDSATPPNSHTGHVHTGPAHRILVESADLSTALNPGATYWAEGQYITPHEYAWCQANPTQCNMNNNVSHRKYVVVGTTSPFSFVAGAATVRMRAAIQEWVGATVTAIQPDAVADGIGAVAYKVTNPSPGIWHYEYAVYNQNLDRAIQSFKVAVSPGVTITNVGFHAPPQHPAWTADGTVGNAGYSSAAWTQTSSATDLTWSSETLVQNPNANAIRWGTLYNFRFDADAAPEDKTATIGFFKSGAPITVTVHGPGPSPVDLMRFNVD